MPYSFNSDLVDDLARQRVVLFLGAGVSASARTTSGGRISGWPGFLEKTAGRLAEPLKGQILSLVNDKDYLLACELLQSGLGEEWEGALTSEFGQVATPSSLHSALIDLDQRIILTTNFDKVFEDSWTKVDRGATHYPKVLSRIDEKIFRILKDHDSRYFLKIHGTIDDLSTIVFSRSEYIRTAFGNANYGNFLESVLLNYTILFVGFSMEDPAITSLMELYTYRYPTARPHYIFSPSNIQDNIIEIHKRLRKLIVMPYDPSHDHAELPLVVAELANAAVAKRKELVAASITSTLDKPAA